MIPLFIFSLIKYSMVIKTVSPSGKYNTESLYTLRKDCVALGDRFTDSHNHTY